MKTTEMMVLMRALALLYKYVRPGEQAAALFPTLLKGEYMLFRRPFWGWAVVVASVHDDCGPSLPDLPGNADPQTPANSSGRLPRVALCTCLGGVPLPDLRAYSAYYVVTRTPSTRCTLSRVCQRQQSPWT